MTRITGEQIQQVYKEESIPGQIPFAAFDEKELEKFSKNEKVDDGESYLKSVILEARKVPDIVRADIKPKSSKKSIDSGLSFKQLSTSSYICKSNFDSNYEVDKSLTPDNDWKLDRLATFEHARQQVANHAGRLRSIRRESKRRPKLPIYPLPEPNDFDSWQKIIFGRTLPRPLESEQDEEEPSPKIEANDTSEDRVINLDEIETGIPPLLRVILRLTTHQISGLFDTLALIIEKNNCLLPRCGEWIFSLLAAQAKPMEPSTASRIRNICRTCRKRRYDLVRTPNFSQSELTMLNLVIVIIGHFFDQKDLQD